MLIANVIEDRKSTTKSALATAKPSAPALVAAKPPTHVMPAEDCVPLAAATDRVVNPVECTGVAMDTDNSRPFTPTATGRECKSALFRIT